MKDLTPKNKKTLQVLAIAGIVLIVAGVAVKIKKKYDNAQKTKGDGVSDTGFGEDKQQKQKSTKSTWDIITGVFGGIFGADLPKTLPSSDPNVIF